MLTIKDIENARWIMSNLELPEEFGGSEDFDVAEYEDKFSSCIQNDFYISCGVSKMVIVFDDLPFVMEKFRRGSNAEGVEGTGLGLYISRNLMTDMRGTMECTNTEDGFKVTLGFRIV